MGFLLKEAVKVGKVPFPDKHLCSAGSSVGMEKWEWGLLAIQQSTCLVFFKDHLCYSVRVHGHGSRVLDCTTCSGVLVGPERLVLLVATTAENLQVASSRSPSAAAKMT